MKYILLFVLIPTILLFFNCVTTDSSTVRNDDNKSETNQQNIPNNSNKSIDSGSKIAYILEDYESLRKLIETQKDLNRYSTFESEPTKNIFKEKFLEYEKLSKEAIDEQIKKITEEDIKKLQIRFNEYFISPNGFIDEYRKLRFFYKIEYTKNTKEWYIELIGRSTTFSIKFANEPFKGSNAYYDSHLSSWMNLNNVRKLDGVFRVYINDIDGEIIPEIFDFPVNLGNK
jgi:hypothetical protein